MTTSWTDRLNLETETISVDAGEVSFTAWWDQLVGLTSRLISLDAARTEANARQQEFNPAHDPYKPPLWDTPQAFFAYHQTLAQRRAAQREADSDVARLNGEMESVVNDIGAHIADQPGRFKLYVGSTEYILEFERLGYGGCRVLAVDSAIDSLF